MAYESVNPVSTDDLPVQSLNLFAWTTHLIDPKLKNEQWALTIFKNYYPYLMPLYAADVVGFRPYGIDLIKQYANGTQSPELYRTMFDPQDKEGKYLGINFNNLPAIIPRYRQKLVADLLKIPVEIKATAVDPVANNKRGKDRERLKMKKQLDKELAEISKVVGYKQPIKSNIDKGILKSPAEGLTQGLDSMTFDLENDEELQLYMDKNSGFYNQDVELAQEQSIEAIFKLSKVQQVAQTLIEDAIDYGAAACRVYCSAFSGMPYVRYEDVNSIQIPCSFRRDFNDVPLWAQAKMVNLNELIDEIGYDLHNVDEIKKIYDFAVRKYGYIDQNSGRPFQTWDARHGQFSRADFDQIKVERFYMEFRSPNIEVYEEAKTRFGGEKMRKRDYGYQAPADSSYNKERKEYWADVIYKGYYIQGIDRIYDFGMLNNMVRVKGREQFTPYSLQYYRFDDRSMVEKMIPHADNIIVLWLKAQYAALKALPPGYSFNVDAMSDILLGDGGKITPIEMSKMYMQTGSTFHHSLDEQGNPILANANAPHMQLPNGLMNGFTDLYTAIQFEFKMIDDAIGTNQYTNASTPSADALVGIQKMAVLNSQDARYYLQFGMKAMIENIATRLSLMIQQIAEYNKDAWEQIKLMVGRYNADLIETMEQIPMSQFAIFAEETLSEQEKQEVKTFLLNAYTQGKLELTDVLQLYFIKNWKLLVKLLNIKYNKRQVQMAQAQQQQSQDVNRQIQEANQLKVLLEQIDAKKTTDAATITGQFGLMREELKANSDVVLKTLQELSKQQKTDKELASKEREAAMA